MLILINFKLVFFKIIFKFNLVFFKIIFKFNINYKKFINELYTMNIIYLHYTDFIY